MIEFVCGKDNYSKLKCIQNICSGREIITFNVEQDDLNKILNEILAVDLFAEPKVYIIENLKVFTNKSESYSKANSAILTKILDADEIIIVPSDNHLKHNLKWSKQYAHKINEHVFDLEDLDFDAAFDKYVSDSCIAIESDALMLIKQNFPNNIMGATRDLDKIWQYTNMQNITIADVQKAGQKVTEQKLFELYNLIATGNTLKAMNFIDLLHNDGITDSEIILAGITTFRRMYECKILIDKGMNDFKISEHIGIPPFAVKQNRKILMNVNIKRLETFVIKMAEYDYLLKSGEMTPDLIINGLVIL